MFEPAYRHFSLRLRETFQRGDPGRHRFRQQLAHRAFFEVDEARDVVVARDEPPQLAAYDQRHDQRRPHAHVLKILDVDGGRAAQEAQRHIQMPVTDWRQAGNQRDRIEFDIDQHAHPVALV